MAYNSYLAASNGNGLRSSTYFDPVFNDFDFEPITNRAYQTSYIPSTLNSSYLNSDILLNSGIPDTSAPLLTQAFNSRNNFTNTYVPSQLNNQQNPKSRNANKQLVNNKGDFNININVDNQNENQYPNSILQQQHQYMLQKKALQNQYFNNQKQLKGGLGYQQQEQNFSNNNNNNNFDFNDLDTFDNKQFTNRNNDNLPNNNDIHRRHQNGGNGGEDNSIASTDAEPIASASPVPRRSNNNNNNNGNNKNNVYEKLYQEAFENNGK